jgi:hypothetical protein
MRERSQAAQNDGTRREAIGRFPRGATISALHHDRALRLCLTCPVRIDQESVAWGVSSSPIFDALFTFLVSTPHD